MKRLFTLVSVLGVIYAVYGIAQPLTSNQAVPAAIPNPFGVDYSVIVMAAYLAFLGLLQRAVHKMPGVVGKILSFIVDTLAGNAAHPKA